VIERFPGSKEALVRMHKEYVSPAESDLVAADAIIFATPRDLKTSEDWKPHLEMLARLRSEGRLEGKLVATLTSATVEEATAQGRKVAAIAREAKEGLTES
jgi:hypothetical protein